jgi:peroxiredoxin
LRVAAPKGRTKIATVTKTLKVGDHAPDFTLRSHDGREITLSALRGQSVVLAFFAFAFTNT